MTVGMVCKHGICAGSLASTLGAPDKTQEWFLAKKVENQREPQEQELSVISHSWGFCSHKPNKQT